MPEFAQWRRTVGHAYLSACQPMAADLRRMAVVTTGRTGSELLVQLLDSHPDMKCDSEVLDYGPDSARLFLRGRAAAAARNGNLAYGFKLTANQLRWPVLIRQPRLLFDDLARTGTVFVRLRRTDIIRQALSHERAKALRTWHGGRADDAPDLCPSDVVHTLVWLDEQERSLDDALAGHQVVDLVYERDLATPELQTETANQVFGVLGLERHEPSADLRRSSPCATTQMVGNWREIADVVAGTRFAPRLETVDPPLLYDTAAAAV